MTTNNPRLTAASVVTWICFLVIVIVILFGGKMPNLTLPFFNGN